MSSSSDAWLISHPHQSLGKHLKAVDLASLQALEAKTLSSFFFPCQNLEQLRQILVYFHDYGKATAFFQFRIIKATERDAKAGEETIAEEFKEYIKAFKKDKKRWHWLSKVSDKEDYKSHSKIGAFCCQVNLSENTSHLFRAQVIEVIARHHGNLENFGGSAQTTASCETLLNNQWNNIDNEAFRQVLQGTGFTFAEDKEEVLKKYGFELQLNLADALDSNNSPLPYLQTLFLFSLLLAGDKGDLMLNGKGHWVGNTKLLHHNLIDNYKQQKFGKKPGNDLNRRRESVYQTIATNISNRLDASFYSITLPTGMGKTFSAYNAAIKLQNLMAKQYQQLEEKTVPKIIYCLPFTSVIDQNAQVFEEILEANKLDDGLLAKHHYLSDWPDQKDEEKDLQHSEKEYLVEGWEYSITITTFVQLLETIFSNRNRQLRKFHNLANAIVIMDELQNIPPKYFEAVRLMLKAISKYMNTKFIFVTATQPLLFEPEDVVELTDPNRKATRAIFERMNRIDLDINRWLSGPEDLEKLITLFIEEVAAEPEKSFLFILNKIAESRKVYQALKEYFKNKENAEFIYLSGSILPCERKCRIQRIKDAKKEGIRTIVVSTQVVEAGVDIDLDIVYRAFAPLDSINQSAGRCNRNAENDRGSVRLFKQPIGGNCIYEAAFIDITEKVLKQATKQYTDGIIPEKEFYTLNEQYAKGIYQAVALESNESKYIIDCIHRLKFEDVNSAFRLIGKRYETFGVFIKAPSLDGSIATWEAYEKIKYDKTLDRWEKKKAFRLLRPKLLEYVVQIPKDGYLTKSQQQEAKEAPFIGMDEAQYSIFYNIEYGYFKPDENIDHDNTTTCL